MRVALRVARGEASRHSRFGIVGLRRALRMAADRTRIAVIGCGAWGRNHVRTLASLGNLYAVADEQGKRSFDIAAEFGVRPLAPMQVLEDERIDGVVLALPAHVHADMAIRAMEAGKHVLVEKPIALRAADAEDVVATAERHDRVLMVGHVLRHHPAFRRLLSEIGGGAIGEPRYVQSHRQGFGRFHAFFDAAWDLAPHDLSLVLAVAGREPTFAVGRSSVALGGSRDNALIYMAFGQTLAAHVSVSRISAHRDRRFTVTGTDGTLVFDDLEDWPRKLVRYRHAVDPHEEGGASFELGDAEPIAVDEAMSLTEELSNFVAAIEGREAPRTPGRDGLNVVRILETALPPGR